MKRKTENNMAILDSLLLDIIWVARVPLVLQVILMAKMLLHLLSLMRKINVSKLSEESGVSRQTLYNWAYRAISILGLACIGHQADVGMANKAATETEIESLSEQIHHLQLRNQELEKHNRNLQDEIGHLNNNLKQMVDKAILVLRLSGKVSYRGIEECIRLIFAVHVPPYVIETTLREAAEQAQTVNQSLLQSIRAKFIGIDEVYLKEAGKRIYGLLVMDLPSRVILSLGRATNRTSDTWKELLSDLIQVKDSLQVVVSDLARAFPALVRKLKTAWKRPLQHQLCNVHAMRLLFKYKKDAWINYRAAKQRLEKAEKAFEKKPNDLPVREEYWSARQLVKFHWRMVCFCSSLISQVIAALRKSNKEEAQSELDKVLQELTTLPSEYQAFANKLANFINNYREKLLLHLEYSDLDWTTNSCEAAFSILRRFVIVYKSFPTQESTERFFSLFVLYYNLKPQHYSDGAYVAPLLRAGIPVTGSYLSYLGYAHPNQIVSYSKLPASQMLFSTPLLDSPASPKVSTSHPLLPQPV